jgi:toxin ParE1/3/4
MRVKWLRKALSNLDDEARYISIEDPVAASVVANRIFDAVNVLIEQPNLGKPGRISGTRELVVSKTRYVVPYRVRAETIEILRVFHTSRRLPSKW